MQMPEIKNPPRIEINLRFFGPIIGIMGKSRETVTISQQETTLKGIILNLCEMYGEKFENIALTKKGELNPGLIVFVNGSHVTDENRKLSVTDEVQVMIASQMKGG